VENTVEQLNDTSTQHNSGATAPTASTTELKKLQTQISALEKQLHAAIGAKHKASANGDTKDRTPSVHSLFLSVEGFRKRLKNLEDMEGATICARFLAQIKVDQAKTPEKQPTPTAQVVNVT
jgi:hypothetical protein